MKREAIATILHDGLAVPQLDIIERNKFIMGLIDFKHNGKVRITITSLYPSRSLPQNNTFHWWCGLLAEYLGMDPEDTKLMMKKKFYMVPMKDVLGNNIVDPETGEIFMVPGSTAKMDTWEMYEFMEKIRLWAIDFLKFELQIPDKMAKLHALEKQKQKLLNEKNGKND